MSRRRLRWLWFAAIAIAFATLQVSSIDYGTRINDQPHVAGYSVEPETITENSGLQRGTIAGAGAGESLDRWMTRYKLYSVEADEHINIMALARMRPEEGAFDPHFYQYGGAWLYPLGAWYLLLSKLGIVRIADFPTLLAEPNRMDNVYVWGRVFTLLSVLAAAGVLFDALRRFAGTPEAVLAIAIFLAAPATVMFSQVMKPHWYALLWIVLAMHALIVSFQRGRLSPGREVVLALSTGLAVGSVLTNGLFAIGVWIALVALVARSQARRWVLLRVPLIALAVYVCVNPYVILNAPAFLAEGRIVSDWFGAIGGAEVIWEFVENSILAGFGLGFSLAALAVAVAVIVHPPSTPVRWLAVLGLVAVGLVSLMTANIAGWHTNTRYVAYLLPTGLALLLAVDWPCRRAALAAVLALTVVQAAPLALAYGDENDPTRSTRLQAAAWLHDNLPAGSGLCLGTPTPAPYDVPPIDFRRFRLNGDDCSFLVVVERRMDDVRIPEGFALQRRFRPALSPAAFPTVFSHVNPQISIYRRTS